MVIFPLYAVFLIFTDNTKGIHHHRVPPFGRIFLVHFCQAFEANPSIDSNMALLMQVLLLPAVPGRGRKFQGKKNVQAKDFAYRMCTACNRAVDTTVDGKNPANHLGWCENHVNHGISTTNLNWFSRRISEPSTVGIAN